MTYIAVSATVSFFRLGEVAGALFFGAILRLSRLVEEPVDVQDVLIRWRENNEKGETVEKMWAS